MDKAFALALFSAIVDGVPVSVRATVQDSRPYTFVTVANDPVHVFWKRSENGQLCARIRRDLLESVIRSANAQQPSTSAIAEKSGNERGGG